MLKLFRNISKRDRCLVLLCIGLIVVQVWLELTIPDYMSNITEALQMPGSTMADVLRPGGKMLLCALGSLAASMTVAVCVSRIASNFAAAVRLRLFEKVQSFSMEEIGGFSTASLITRSTNDVTQIQTVVVMGLQVLVKAPVTAGWAIAKIANKNWQWTLSTGVAVAVLLVIVLLALLIVLPKFKRLQRLTDDLNRVTREDLTGLRVIRAYNAERYQEHKFAQANNALTDTQLFTTRSMSLLMPSISLVMNGLSLAIYWLGAIMIENAAGMAEKAKLLSDMVVFSSYAMQVVMSFMMLVMIFILLPRATVSAKRILEVLETPLRIRDGARTEGIESGTVEFRDVSFRYPNADGEALRHITFTAKKGETVAFIGATGSGKSTLVNLIPRFYDATEGTVLVDGTDVRDYRQESLRDRIGYVAQKAVLFSGTVRSNVAYGDNGKAAPDDDAVREAVTTAQATDFVEKMSGDYDGYIAQSGANLSGGQKQRLSIARAVARKPEILIFDDSFSALDYKTDRAVRNALEQTCAGTTRLIVAQRIGTIRDADKIIVLDEGEMAGIGTHDELMRTCEVYRQIALSQLSKEELESCTDQ